MAGVLVVQVAGLAVLGCGSLLAGLLPLCLARRTANLARPLSCLACYGGGVILATAFTHLLPEVHRFLEFNRSHGQLPPSLVSLPLAEIFTLAGFFLVFGLEAVAEAGVARCVGPAHTHAHSHAGPEADPMLAVEKVHFAYLSPFFSSKIQLHICLCSRNQIEGLVNPIISSHDNSEVLRRLRPRLAVADLR